MLHHHPRWRRSLLVIALGWPLLPLEALAAEPARTELRRHYHIAAGSLARAVTQLGREAGVLISFGTDLAAGRQSSELEGNYTPTEALQRLLQNTGLEAVSDNAGGFVLQLASGPVGAAKSAAAVNGPHRSSSRALPDVHASAERSLEPGRQIISAREIADTPTANQSLSELVAINPAVRLPSKAGGSLTRGSMDVEDISFYGASPYQNLFQIDGMDSTNNINPANHNTNLQVTNVPSNSQAYFVDTSLLGEVRIYDSNVPVEYGRFNGGVVDARLKRASGKNGIDFSYRMSGSNLSEQKIALNDQYNYTAGLSGYTPDWRKKFYSVNIDRMLADDVGLVLGVSRRESSVRRTGYVGILRTVAQGVETQVDAVDNVLAKLTWWKNASTISDLTFKYSQRNEERSDAQFKDTRWSNNHGAIGVAWNLEHRLDKANLTLQAGWDRFEDSRISNATELVTHITVAPPSTVTTGGFGHEEKKRDSMSFNGKLNFDPFMTGPFEHSAYVGFDAQWIDVNYERFNEAFAYQLRYLANGTKQQRSKTRYLPGTVDLSYHNEGVFLADQIRLDRVSFTPGLRIDRDSYLNNTNVAPRTRVDWDVFGNRSTVLTAGASRYYGGSILDLALREGVSKLKQSILDSAGNPSTVVNAGEISRYDRLKTPYNDEVSLALSQELGGVRGVLSYVRRAGRDQINKQPVRNAARVVTGYEFVNDGQSDTEAVGLSLTNEVPWKFATANWQARASLSYERFNSNNNLINGYEDSVAEGKIYYNGVLIDMVDRPIANFNQPVRATFQLNAAWDQLGLRWNNQFNWRSSREDVFYVGINKADQLDMYKEGTVPSYWTWDASFSYRPSFDRDLELTVDILNVLNRTPKLVSTTPISTKDMNQYSTGREIWLQVKHSF